MEPSPLSDGNPRTPMSSCRRSSSLQWSRRLSATETLFHGLPAADIRGLQWSRRLSATETDVEDLHGCCAPRASMEPSPLSDGNRLVDGLAGTVLVASMEPSPLSDGNTASDADGRVRSAMLQWSRRLSATETTR